MDSAAVCLGRYHDGYLREEHKMRSRRRRRRSRAVIIIPLVLVCLMAAAAGMAFLWFAKGQAGVRQAAPDERFMEYTQYWCQLWPFWLPLTNIHLGRP